MIAVVHDTAESENTALYEAEALILSFTEALPAFLVLAVFIVFHEADFILC